MSSKLITFTENGFYCPRADVYIDPWKPVDKAIITHAHSDHARWGHQHYLAHHQSEQIMRHRLGADIHLECLDYGQSIYKNGVEISLHPSGHIYGAAQIRLSYKGETWVLSGDYKREDDGISQAFEPVKCTHFVTESTFGLPVFQWQKQEDVFAEINEWWRDNQEKGLVSVITAYALGKAQRIIKHIDHSIGKVYVHGAVHAANEALAKDGLLLPQTTLVSQEIPKADYKNSLIIAVPAALNTPWMKKFAPYSTAICSGWMAIRGNRRRRAADRGFVLSDHADWGGLVASIKDTGAENIYTTHGYSAIFSKYLTEEMGLNAQEVKTEFEGDSAE